jgi:hypothetical protein
MDCLHINGLIENRKLQARGDVRVESLLEPTQHVPQTLTLQASLSMLEAHS